MIFFVVKQFTFRKDFYLFIFYLLLNWIRKELWIKYIINVNKKRKTIFNLKYKIDKLIELTDNICDTDLKGAEIVNYYKEFSKKIYLINNINLLFLFNYL